MMRRVLLVTAACCLFAAPALAGGGVDLYATYGEVIEGEAALGAGGRFSIGGTNWMFDASVTQFAEVEGVSEIGDDDVSVRAFDLGLRYLFMDPTHKLRPYLGAGLTSVHANATDVSIDSGVGAYGMFGLRFGKTPGIQFMAEVIYRWVEVEATSSVITEPVDVAVAGLALQTGVSFIF